MAVMREDRTIHNTNMKSTLYFIITIILAKCVSELVSMHNLNSDALWRRDPMSNCVSVYLQVNDDVSGERPMASNTYDSGTSVTVMKMCLCYVYILYIEMGKVCFGIHVLIGAKCDTREDTVSTSNDIQGISGIMRNCINGSFFLQHYDRAYTDTMYFDILQTWVSDHGLGRREYQANGDVQPTWTDSNDWDAVYRDHMMERNNFAACAHELSVLDEDCVKLYRYIRFENLYVLYSVYYSLDRDANIGTLRVEVIIGYIDLTLPIKARNYTLLIVICYYPLMDASDCYVTHVGMTSDVCVSTEEVCPLKLPKSHMNGDADILFEGAWTSERSERYVRNPGDPINVNKLGFSTARLYKHELSNHAEGAIPGDVQGFANGRFQMENIRRIITLWPNGFIIDMYDVLCVNRFTIYSRSTNTLWRTWRA